MIGQDYYIRRPTHPSWGQSILHGCSQNSTRAVSFRLCNSWLEMRYQLGDYSVMLEPVIKCLGIEPEGELTLYAFDYRSDAESYFTWLVFLLFIELLNISFIQSWSWCHIWTVSFSAISGTHPNHQSNQAVCVAWSTVGVSTCIR